MPPGRHWKRYPINSLTNTHCAYVTLVGMTNAGKSSLLNVIADRKISITSPKPQTTRNLVYGLLSQNNRQAVLVDTPGDFDSPSVSMKGLIQQQITQGLYEGQIILLVIDAKKAKLNERFFKFAAKEKLPLLVAINKVDLLKRKNDILPLTDSIVKLGDKHNAQIKEIVAVSARKDINIDTLRDILLAALPVAPFLYDPDTRNINREEFIASELLREQIFCLVHKEIPFGVNVICDMIEERQKKLKTGGEQTIKHINLTLLIRKESHKAIILGVKGNKMKEIATQARLAMEEIFATKVMLRIRIKIAKDLELAEITKNTSL